MDGSNEDTRANCHKEFVTAENIVHLLSKYGVRRDVDYVSIDIDSADLWVMRAIVRSAAFRPKVISVEYNSNFPWEASLSFPPPSDRSVPPRLRRWDGDCYLGSSASALAAAAAEGGYVVIDIERGFDLFLAPAELWAGRPVPTLDDRTTLWPFNIRRNHRSLLNSGKAAGYLEYATYARARAKGAGAEGEGADEDKARIAAHAASRPVFDRLRASGLPCFVEHQCPLEELVNCRQLWALLCPRNASSQRERDPCRHWARYAAHRISHYH